MKILCEGHEGNSMYEGHRETVEYTWLNIWLMVD